MDKYATQLMAYLRFVKVRYFVKTTTGSEVNIVINPLKSFLSSQKKRLCQNIV